MTALRVAIVDDEPLARARLRRLLGKVGNGTLEVVAECVDAEELIAIADSARLDVLFLDIEMPGVGGFGALARWQGPRPQVVFVTAYPQHGVRAFDARATDYLMKPVSADRLRDTLKRVRESMPALAASAPVPGEGKRLSLQVGQRTHLVPVDQVDLVLAQGNYLDVHAAGAVYTVRGTLTEFHGGLEAQCFVRVHRSAVVRIAAVREIRPIGSGRFRISLWGGQHLHSGRHYRDQVHDLIG